MHIIRLPRLGQTMEHGILNAWSVAEGATFAAGDVLYEVETDKMNTEVEAKQDGVLVRVVAQISNDELPVGSILAVAADPAESPSAAEIDALLAVEAGIAPAVEPEPEIAAPDTDAEPANPAAAADPAPAPVFQPSPAQRAAARPLAVPAARHLARQLGIELASISGTGEHGTIRVTDVEAAAAAVAANADQTTHPVVTPPATVAQPIATSVDDAPVDGPALVAARIPVQGMVRAMADAMVRSWAVPQFTQQITVDATALVARLKRLRYEGVPVSYNDLIIAATAGAAREVPEVNATFAGSEIVRFAEVNVSIAIATDRGLLVPVVRRADSLSIADIAAASKDLAERAKQGRLAVADLAGGTITVSNLGAFGVDTGMPLLNAPQCALVFIGSLADRPAVVDGQLVAQKQLNVAIAYDHRVVDGMTAAGFTRAVRTRLEAGG